MFGDRVSFNMFVAEMGLFIGGRVLLRLEWFIGLFMALLLLLTEPLPLAARWLAAAFKAS